MNTLEKIVLGLTQTEKKRQKLSPMYTEDPFEGNIFAATAAGSRGKLDDFVKARNPYVYTKLYADEGISPQEAYQIVTDQRVPAWERPNESAFPPSNGKIEDQIYPTGWTQEDIDNFTRGGSAAPVDSTVTPPQQEAVQNVLERLTLPGDPVQDIVADEATIQRFVDNARYYAGTTKSEEWPGQYPYRQPDKLAENQQYVAEYVDAAMRLAPYYDLPPKTIAAMLMQESGWGGQRFDGNLGGYGFLEGGTDMGIRFDAPTVAEQAQKYLEKLSSDWEGKYRGSRSPEDFHAKGYNQHERYPTDVMNIYNMLDAQ